jgi:hypothetical protein
MTGPIERIPIGALIAADAPRMSTAEALAALGPFDPDRGVEPIVCAPDFSVIAGAERLRLRPPAPARCCPQPRPPPIG